MWPFKQIKNWFFPKEYLEYKPTVAELIKYLPVGNLDALLAWTEKWAPYTKDTDPLKLDNYNGADLTIKAKGGDCESKAAVYSEVIREWKGWSSHHVLMAYTSGKAHDVATFVPPGGGMGWIDGSVHQGGYEQMRKFYAGQGWYIVKWWTVNDIGQVISTL